MEIIDTNNMMITVAQSFASDKKTAANAYDITAMRKVMISFVSKHIQAGRKVTLAVDSNSWRKDFFPLYKFRRYEDKGRSDFEYDRFIGVMQAVVDEMREHSPCAVVRVPGAEGDDIVAVLTALFCEEGVVIHSTDGDLLQLQEYYPNVRQFSPSTWKYITPASKEYDINEHIVRGDSGDGVPNVYSEDNVFAERIRSVVLTKPRYDAAFELVKHNSVLEMDADFLRRYKRNKKLVDLREIPDDVAIRIISAFEEEASKVRPVGAYSRYLASHGIV